MTGRLDSSARDAVEDAAAGWLDELDGDTLDRTEQLLDEAGDLADAEPPELVGMPKDARERLRLLRAAQLTPLRERRAMRDLGDLGADPAPPNAAEQVHAGGPRAGQPRGVAALIPAAEQRTPRQAFLDTAAAVQGEPYVWDGADRRAPVRIDGRHRLEADWLVTSSGRVLHHASLTAAECEALAADDGVERDTDPQPFTLTCGRTAWAVARPNRLERAASVRCDGCSTTLGYPTGHGAPAADPACEPVLLARLGRLL